MANNIVNKSSSLFDDDFFDDSSFLAKLEKSAFEEILQPPRNCDTSIDKSFLNISALCCDEEISGYDKLTGKTWVYPTNYPVRDYQFNIINAAILKNTLVSLPTGLGKTFIAAVIMYNFYRWYPLGKIVFTAPTRPLVAQQIEACYKIVAIPLADTIEMTGHMPVNTRKTHWQTKRVFFATPQVVYNDIKSGICPGQKIRCLVIDEAHRARGNYAYCQIISTLTEMGHTVYRVLALSATPGSKVDDVINVVKNLHIAHLEFRTENCIDVAPYSHSRKINTVVIQLGSELTLLRKQYVEILDGYARRLKQFNILPQNLGNLSKGRVVMLYKEYQSKDRSARKSNLEALMLHGEILQHCAKEVATVNYKYARDNMRNVYYYNEQMANLCFTIIQTLKRHPQHNYIMKDFTLIISLFHGLELLVKHGSRVFLNFFDEHPEKSWIQTDDQLTSLLERLRDDLGIDPLSLDRSILPDGTIPEMPKQLVFGHPKFYKLKEIMLEHFNEANRKGQDTRAIVFCEYRESVNLVHCLLLQCRPLIVPQMFVGQGASGKNGKAMVSQKQQLRVMRSFRAGECNTLVCTCVAEEGLDVGSVDLIICFDISTRSPVRLVQRCGRTGRERGGQVHILVTEGREHQTLLDCMRQRDGLNKKIIHSKEVENNLYKLNPRLIPRDFMPECQKMYMTIPKTDNKEHAKESTAKAKKGQKDLRNMFLGGASTSKGTMANSPRNGEWLTKAEFDAIYPKGYRDCNFFSKPVEYWSMSKEMLISKQEKEDEPLLKLTTWLELQRTLQETVSIGHSVDTNILTELLQYNHREVSNLPLTSQNPTPNTQHLVKDNFIISTPTKGKQTKKKQKITLTKSPSKNGDIRALFSTGTKSTKSYTKLVNELNIDGKIPTRVINLLVDLSLEKTKFPKECFFCQNVCNCSIFQMLKRKETPSVPISIENLYLPDVNLIDCLSADSLSQYVKNTVDNGLCLDKENKNALQDKTSLQTENEKDKNFDLEFDFGSLSEHNSPEVASKSYIDNKDNNFDIGDLEDIFADSPVTEENNDNSRDSNKTLEYFGLNSVDDMFAETDNEEPDHDSDKQFNTAISNNDPSLKMNTTNDSASTNLSETKKSSEVYDTKTLLNNYPTSPSLISGRTQQRIVPSTSPILCSNERQINISTINQVQSSTPISTAKKKFNLATRKIAKTAEPSLPTKEGNISATTNTSMLTITQLVNIINETDRKSPLFNNSFTSNETTNPKKINDVSERSSSMTQPDTSRNMCPINIYEKDRKYDPLNCNVTTNQNKVDSVLGRSSSPILMTQRDRHQKMCSCNQTDTTKVKSKTKINNTPSVVIPDSDSDFEDTKDMSDDDRLLIEQNKQANRTPDKRKVLIDNMATSPYFSKKQKLGDIRSKPLTLQEKVLAALTSSKTDSFANNIHANFAFYSPTVNSEKENEHPLPFNSPEKDSDGDKVQATLAKLQIFRRGSKLSSRKTVMSDSTNNLLSPRKLRFEDSDDDFVTNDKPYKKQKIDSNGSNINKAVIEKLKKQKRNKKSEFLDLEAELSDDGKCMSGDELSDDSIGSIIDFICDKNVSHDDDVDMHALYLRSVKSPVNGGFKIPQVTNKYNKFDVLSQCVEEDAYEMDSFCVDSHIGLTQANDVSELEVAEMLLEEKRKSRKRFKGASKAPKDNGDSPIVKRKRAYIKRQIQSDSEDSS